jgi:hypothetical protein
MIPGANSLGADRAAAPDDTRVVRTLGDWYEFNITAMAAAWVAAPDENYGLVLKGMSGPQVSYDMVSSQFQVAQGAFYRPRLILSYSIPPGPTPTPTQTRTPTATSTRSYTYLPIILSLYEPPATETPTATASPIAPPTETATPTITPTETPQPTATATATQTRIPLTIVFRQGTSPFPLYGGVQDTYLSDSEAGDATTNFADRDLIALRPSNHRVGLVRFDVSAIPPTATVLMANLSIYVDSQTPGAGPMTVSVHEMARAWVGSQTTWLQAAAGLPWAAAGAKADSDRNPQPAASFTLSQAGAWADADVRGLVQSWVAGPAANKGVLLAAPGNGVGEYRLRSSEYPDTSFRPKLVVSYAP